MLGTYALSAGYYDAYYLKAQKVRTLIKQDFDQAFDQVDALVSAASPVPPFRIGEKSDDPLQMYLADVFTLAQPLAGIPAITLPAGFSGDTPGLPIGMQIIDACLSGRKIAARCLRLRTNNRMAQTQTGAVARDSALPAATDAGAPARAAPLPRVLRVETGLNETAA